MKSELSYSTKITCDLCPRQCQITENNYGFCQVRKNQGGRIVPAEPVFISSLALDRIEKKPLRNFHPGKKILSVGFWGCNMLCSYCQNHQISHPEPNTIKLYGKSYSPAYLCQLAKRAETEGNIGLAFTYNEPLTSYEFVLETARLAKTMDLQTVVVSNGCFSLDKIKTLAPYIDAWNIDLKSMNSEYYRSLFGDLETVKRNIEYLALISHVEVTNLIVTDKNDSEAEMEELGCFLAAINPQIPLHISRSFPQWLCQDLVPPSIEKLKSLVEIAEKYLRYVYTGNF